MFKSAHHRNEKQYSLLKTHSIKKKPRFSLEKRALRKAFGIFFLRYSLKRTRFNAFKKVRLKSSENVLIGKRRVETLFCTIFFSWVVLLLKVFKKFIESYSENT